jgi:hypothetical protein
VPHGPAHRTQRRKNLFMLAFLVVLMALFYAMTIVKMSPQ